jgi:hypothetical protein
MVFLVVPTGEDMARRREDVRGATLGERNDSFEFWRRERERRTLRRRPVLSASMVKTRASTRTWVGIDLSSSFGLRPCKDLLDW